jgi:2-isopropylmalate synthase
LVAAAQGDGPVDAVCRAINNVVGDLADLVEFTVDPVTEGIDAVGGVTMRLRERATETVTSDAAPAKRSRVISGFGVHTDVIVASAEAYLSALNSIVRSRNGVGATRIDPPSLTRVGGAAHPAGALS